MEDLQRSDLEWSERLVPLGLIGTSLRAPTEIPRTSVVIIPRTKDFKQILNWKSLLKARVFWTLDEKKHKLSLHQGPDTQKYHNAMAKCGL